MGIHLPFIGYVRASGARRNRMDPELGKSNAGNIKDVREFFECMRDVQRSLLMQFVPNRIDVDFDHAFEEFLFEEDEGERPVLRKFIGRRGPKSLVVPNFNHLFDERNPTVEMFAKKALKTFIPII
jgi:hypothetical protein